MALCQPKFDYTHARGENEFGTNANTGAYGYRGGRHIVAGDRENSRRNWKRQGSINWALLLFEASVKTAVNGCDPMFKTSYLVYALVYIC